MPLRYSPRLLKLPSACFESRDDGSSNVKRIRSMNSVSDGEGICRAHSAGPH